jgi:hypothetical protein
MFLMILRRLNNLANPFLLKQLKEICNRYHVEIMYAYGSRCLEVLRYIKGKGSMDKNNPSDVDIGIKPFKDYHLSVKDKVELIIEIEDLFRVGRVDLVVLSEADPFLAANIIRGERLFYESGYMADEYELYILRRAGDLAPLERERLNLILEEAK